MSEASAQDDHSDEVILPIIALEAGYNGAVISITKDLNLYVRAGGSDVNSGYVDTDQHAFSTGTRAYEEAKRFVPTNGAQIIINLGDGLFLPIEAVGPISGPPVVFRGKGANRTSVLKGISPSSGNAAVYSEDSNIQLEGFTVGGNGLGNGLHSTNGGTITVGAGMSFGSVTDYQMQAVSGGKIYNYEPYTITGGGVGHMSSRGSGSAIEGGDNVVTITGPIEFTSAFAEAGAEGYIYNTGATYVGRDQVVGRRFYVYEWGYINTEGSGPDYFPGDVPGEWETGGRYDEQGGANQGPPGVAGPMGPKAMSLQLPVANDEVSLFYAKSALLLTQINVVVRGTTPGVTWTILWASARNAVGTPVITAGTTTTTLANNTIVTFNNPNIPANSWVWLKVTATSGVVLEMGLSLQF